MFFPASKILWAVAVPSTALVLLILVGIVLALGRRRSRRGAGLAAAAALALAVIGLGPPAAWLLTPLENRFPAYREDGARVAGIIVLGGSIYTDVSVARGQLSLGEANERLIALADLARRHPDAVLVFAGGSGNLVFEDTPEAETVRRFGAVLGFDPGRVRYDSRSRSTWENAVEARKLVEPKAGERWLLVTSARHMPRSVGCFRRAGMDVVAYPVDYLTTGRPGDASWPPTVAIGAARFDDALKEWVGLLLYRLSGRTDALFPAS
ncbi:MAG: YdcF family protein [Enterovirga sp.]|nr:YdcF family protein [Enterovirga sp.]